MVSGADFYFWFPPCTVLVLLKLQVVKCSTFSGKRAVHD